MLEKPLLLDPCHDEPAEHLVFTRKGTVAALTDRGQTTIEIFALNRYDLVARRRRVAEELAQQLKSLNLLIEGDPSKAQSTITDLLAPEIEFAGFRQHLVETWVDKLPNRSIVALRGRAHQSGVAASNTFTEAAAVERTESVQSRVDRFAIDSPNRAARNLYFTRARYIERIEIENFRGLSKLDFDMRAIEPDAAPWTILVGENGSGKSSVLQAVCLALIGPKYRERLGLSPSSFVKRGTTQAVVRVFLSASSRPIELYIRAGRGGRFLSPAQNQSLLLLAYGSTRLLPSKYSSSVTSSSYTRVRNLFDPYAALLDAEKWLLRLSRRQFEAASSAIWRLFGFDTRAEIVRRAGKILISFDNERMGLRQLSDGYQTVIATACDVMSVLFTYWADVTIAEAVVLLDEVETHLHPRWKLAIVTALRRCFPRVQFVATTHDPLCLRGVGRGELIVLRRLKTGVAALFDVPPPRLLRVDELLTSDLFGLNTTFDAETDSAFARYYDLLARTRRSKEENAEMQRLAAMVSEKSPLGSNPRDQAVMAVIDDYLAKARSTVDKSERKQLLDSARESAVGIWDAVIRGEES